MLRQGSRFMVATGKLAGKLGTVVDVETNYYPEICAILDVDREYGEEEMYSYFPLKNVIEI